MPQQHRHVVAALAQRRNRQANYVETIVQVLAEFALADALREIAVRGGDNPHVDAAVDAIRANALNLAVLDEAKEQCLHPQRRLAKLVEKQRAVVRHRGEPGLVAVRPGEAATDMSKQLGLEKRVGESGAVDRHEVACPAAPGLVNRARDDFFPNTGFADDEHLGVGSSGCVDVLAESLHRVAAPEKKGSRRNSVRGLSASNECQLLCSHWFFVCLTGEFSGAFLLILQDSREQDTTATIRRNSTLKDARRTKSHITRAKESKPG